MHVEAVVIKDVLPYLRAKMTYARRTVYAAIAASMVAMGGAGASLGGARTQAATGSALFDAILWIILVTGVAEATFLGATSIASERQRNTVGLWVLAGMEQFGMVAAKTLTVITRTFAVVVAPAVPGAVALYLGGRSVVDASVGFLAVMSIIVFVASLAVFVSSFCRRNSDAIPASVAAMLVFAVGPFALLMAWSHTKAAGASLAGSLLALHPFMLLVNIGEERGGGFVLEAFLSLCLSLAAGVILAAVAGARLRMEDAPAQSRLRPARRLDRALAVVWPSLLHVFKPPPGDPDEDPIRWRERIALANSKALFGAMSVVEALFLAAGAGGFLAYTYYRWVLARGAVTAGDLADTAGIVFALAAVVILIYRVSFLVRASQGFSREFESGQMDLLLLTRLDGEDIVRGKLAANVRHFSPVSVLAAVVALGMLLVYTRMPGPDGRAQAMGIAWTVATEWALCGFPMAAVALFASLYFASGTRAMFGALMVYFLPGVMMFTFGMAFMLMPLSIMLSIQTGIGIIVLMRIRSWARTHDGSRSRQECLVLAGLAGVGGAASGPFLGPLVVYFAVRALLYKNFGALAEHDAEGRRFAPRMPALSYEYLGRYSLTHLGVPPSIETRLIRPKEPRVLRSIGEIRPPRGA